MTRPNELQQVGGAYGPISALPDGFANGVREIEKCLMTSWSNLWGRTSHEQLTRTLYP
jgi:hypothetical protein